MGETILDEKILERVNSKKIVVDAYKLAEEAHKGQPRKNDGITPYITHPVAVANILASYGADDETIVAGYLHDVVEDTKVALEEVREKFGDKIAFLVDGVTKVPKGKFKEGDVCYKDTYSKVRHYSVEDKRVLMIKLADRIHNISTPLQEEGWKIKYKVSTSLYIRLGRELGFDSMCDELEELVNKNLN